MANRYWVGASNQNWGVAANWSATSGGAGGASVPTMDDDVFLDAGSTRNCTQSVKDGAMCRNFTVTSGFSYAFTLNDDSYRLRIHGNVNIQKANFWNVSGVSNRGEIIITGATNTTINVPNPIGGIVSTDTLSSKELRVSKTSGARAKLLSNLNIDWAYIGLSTSAFIQENMVIENNSLDTNGYRLITYVLKAPSGTDADITFKPLPAAGHRPNNSNIVFNGDVVFNRGSALIPGNTFTYTFNGPVTFGTTGGAVKTTIGQGSIVKSSGVFMAREANVVNNTASGGALFRAPTNLNNTNDGGNTGWNFSTIRTSVKKNNAWSYTVLDGKLNKSGIFVDL